MTRYEYVRALARERIKFGNFSYWLAAGLVFLATFSASLYYWYSLRSSMLKDLNTTFSQQIQDGEDVISKRLQSYEDIMRGGAGLFKASPQVSRDQWKTFITEFDLQQRYPGAQSFGYLSYVQSGNKKDFLDNVRMRDVPDFTIQPEGDRPEYATLLYAEPYTDTVKKYLGYDMLTDPVRNDAMMFARDSGEPTASGKISSLDDKAKGITDNPAFMLFIPVYDTDKTLRSAAERQVALQGFVFASFRVKNLLSGTLPQNRNPNFGFEIYDTTETKPESYLYKSEDYDSLSKQSGSVLQTRPFRFDNHTWSVRYIGSSDLIPQREQVTPLAALLRGLVTSLFFGFLVYYLLVNRARKLSTEKQEEVQTAKDELLSLASHQLRTPATVVKQYVGMLLHGYAGNLEPQQVSMLQKAYDSNERQLQIINQILYVARLDAGRITLNKTNLNLSNLVRDVYREHTESAREHNQKLRSKIPRKRIMAQADRQYLHMAIDNLISNAIKYTPDGGTIAVKLEVVGSRAHIIISDTGVGINKDSIPYVFDKFTRIDNDLSTQASGSGIGLYLAGQIISLHGGSIEVESEERLGSTFKVLLPLKETQPNNE